jgi:hypothetical protein
MRPVASRHAGRAQKIREMNQQRKTMKRRTLIRCGLAALTFATVLLGAARTAQAQAKKLNIVVIMTDDVGAWDISAYHRGMMGAEHPTSTE